MTDPIATIHATTVAIESGGIWHAVAILGASGSGKSDLALRLIDRGARLVADDYTEMRAGPDAPIASPPERIAGQIEVRGIGIVAMPYLSGAPLALAVALGEPVERMPEAETCTIAGHDVPRLALAPFEASAPIKVEIALRGIGERP